MGAPSIVYSVNMTVVLSILGVALTAMTALVAIFRKRTREEDKPGQNSICKQQQTDMSRMERTTKEIISKLESSINENSKKNEELKQLFNDLGKEIVILQSQSKNTTKSLDEMKLNVKDVAAKLDDLLKQLMDWMTD